MDVLCTSVHGLRLHLRSHRYRVLCEREKWIHIHRKPIDLDTMMARVSLSQRKEWSPLCYSRCPDSQSTGTGVAPARRMDVAQEMIVNVGRMTSSPGRRSSAAIAASSATEPFITATACLRFTCDANLLQIHLQRGHRRKSSLYQDTAAQAPLARSDYGLVNRDHLLPT